MIGATLRAATPPPAISGGTLLSTRDGALLVATDPDRDQLYFVDVRAEKLLHVRALQAGDEPGRVVEDAKGRIHVVLRGGRSIATLTREPNSAITRREVCAVPRGIAYDAAHDQLHVACAEGRLVSLGAAPDAGVSRTLDVGSDARDVIVRGDQLFVSHFRSAELQEIGAGGESVWTRKPVRFARQERVRDANSCSPGGGREIVQRVDATPSVAWRAIDVPNRGIAMLHQRSRVNEIQTTTASGGAYGVTDLCGTSIVRSSLTLGLDEPDAASSDLGTLTLAVDVASDPNGEMLAIAAPGNYGFLQQVVLLEISRLTSAPRPEAASTPPAEPIENAAGCDLTDTSLSQSAGQVTAVTFVSQSLLAAQQREPAVILLYELGTRSLKAEIHLEQASRADTGHTMFHMRAGSGLACASCHPEAGDDGHVWTFPGVGARRTQNLRGGILGTEPFHWDGDLKDFGRLMTEVFALRMQGFEVAAERKDVLAQWIDKQPALHADARDPAAAARGQQLFESEAVGCTGCHTGPHRTSNQNQDVGTGARLQVPALKGLLFRTPLMHDGCAPTIASRFSDEKCGGGDNHGHVKQLSSTQLADLIAYLETL